MNSYSTKVKFSDKIHMSTFKKSVLLVTVLFLIIPQVYGEQNSGTIHIGAILPLTGELGYIGTEMQRGMEIALADFQSPKIQISYEDDHSLDKTAAVNAAQRLIHTKKISVLFNAAVNTIHPLAPIVSKEHLPTVVLWDNNKTTESLGKYIYALGYSTEAAGEDMASYVVTKRKVTKVSVLSMHDEWSEIISKAFTEKFSQLKGTILFHETVDQQSSDLHAVLIKAMKEKPDAIYLPLLPPLLVTAIKQLKELHYGGLILTGDGFGHSEIEQLGPMSDGILATQLRNEDETFHSKYRAKFGNDIKPINLGFAALGYDSVKLVHDLALSVQSENKTFTDLLFQFHFNGISGSLSFGRKGNLKREQVLEVKNKMLKDPL